MSNDADRSGQKRLHRKSKSTKSGLELSHLRGLSVWTGRATYWVTIRTLLNTELACSRQNESPSDLIPESCSTTPSGFQEPPPSPFEPPGHVALHMTVCARGRGLSSLRRASHGAWAWFAPRTPRTRGSRFSGACPMLTGRSDAVIQTVVVVLAPTEPPHGF